MLCSPLTVFRSVYWHEDKSGDIDLISICTILCSIFVQCALVTALQFTG